MDTRPLKSSTFFHHPVEVLSSVAEHLELDLDRDYFQELLNDGFFDEHSKSDIVPFDRSAYEQEKQEVTRALKTEIQEGIDWVSQISEDNPIPSSLPRPVTL